MTRGMPRAIMLDTNVWLDAFDGNRARSSEANKLIDVCEAADIDLLYAATSSKDVYYLLCASLKHQARAVGERVTAGRARAISAYLRARLCELDGGHGWLAYRWRVPTKNFCRFEDRYLLGSGAHAICW